MIVQRSRNTIQGNLPLLSLHFILSRPLGGIGARLVSGMRR